MSYKNKLLEFAKKELTHINFQDTDAGKSILCLLENLATITGSDKKMMHDMVSAIPRLIDLQPISVITEDDFEVDEKINDAGVEIIEQCTRAPYIYRCKDGKYYDDRYYTFKLSSGNSNHKMFIYQCGKSSKQEITLPYLPKERIIYLEDNDQANVFQDVVSSSQ